MILALLSDTHDRREVMEHIVSLFPQYGVTHILHTGDLVSPWMLPLLQPYRYPTWYVFGNNEEEHEELIQVAEQNSITLFMDVGEFQLDGRSIACTHYPRVAESIAAFRKHDLIVHGHSHRKKCERLSHGGYLVNPGTSGGERGPASFAVYNTQLHKVDLIDVNIRQTHWSF